jgi:flagellar assembly protein FliH
MADLSALLGKSGGFQPDARFAALPDTASDNLPAALAAMGRHMGDGLHRHAAQHAMPGTPPEPLPDPIAQARAEGYAQGAQDAQAAAKQDAEQADALRAQLAHAFQRVDGDLAEQFRQRLMDTIVALCEATLAPLALDPTALAHRVEKAAAMFARADDERLIRLHPDDLKLIRAQLPKDWHFTPDPTLERGAIRVESRHHGVESGGVEDGPAQWRRAIAAALNLGGLD